MLWPGRLQSGTSGAQGGTLTHSRLIPSVPRGRMILFMGNTASLSKATRTGCAHDKACAAHVPTQRPRCVGTPVARTLTSSGVSVHKRQEVVYVGPFPPTETAAGSLDAAISEAAPGPGVKVWVSEAETGLNCELCSHCSSWSRPLPVTRFWLEHARNSGSVQLPLAGPSGLGPP